MKDYPYHVWREGSNVSQIYFGVTPEEVIKNYIETNNSRVPGVLCAMRAEAESDALTIYRFNFSIEIKVERIEN